MSISNVPDITDLASSLTKHARGTDWSDPEDSEDEEWAYEEQQDFLSRQEGALDDAYHWGAAALGGLLGMAEAIRRGPAWVKVCGLHSPPYCGGPCMACGYDDGMRRSEDGETWMRATPDRSVDR